VQAETDMSAMHAAVVQCNGEPGVCCWDGAGEMHVFSLMRLRSLHTFKLQDSHPLLAPNAFQVLSVLQRAAV